MNGRGTVGRGWHHGLVHTTEELAARASSLLLAVAAGDQRAAVAYDTLMYPLVLAAVRKRGQLLVRNAQEMTGTDGLNVPMVQACDKEWIANDVTVLALERARARASSFDPDRGDGATWALRQASFAYVDVVRDAYGSRRGLSIVPVEDESLYKQLSLTATVPTPERVVEARAALDAALAEMPVLNRKVLLLALHHGFTYVEIAEILFLDPTATKKVDKILQASRRMLKNAQARWSVTVED